MAHKCEYLRDKTYDNCKERVCRGRKSLARCDRLIKDMTPAEEHEVEPVKEHARNLSKLEGYWNKTAVDYWVIDAAQIGTLNCAGKTFEGCRRELI